MTNRHRGRLTAERARIRRELLEALPPGNDAYHSEPTVSQFHNGWNHYRDEALAALDRILPEEEPNE